MLHVVVALAALIPPSVKFEKDGLRVGGQVLSGVVLELKESGAILASANVVEPLSAEVKVEVAEGRTLVVEPGVRVSRTKEGFQLSTHAGRALKVHGAAFKVASPAAFSLTEKGWDFGSNNILAAAELRVGLQQPGQENPDDSLDAMRRAARRVAKDQVPAVQRPAAPQGNQRTVPTDPTVGGEPVDSQTLRSQQHVTPVGF